MIHSYFGFPFLILFFSIYINSAIVFCLCNIIIFYCYFITNKIIWLAVIKNTFHIRFHFTF